MTFQLQTDKSPSQFHIIFLGMNPLRAQLRGERGKASARLLTCTSISTKTRPHRLAPFERMVTRPLSAKSLRLYRHCLHSA